jgi:hypothetical protein
MDNFFKIEYEKGLAEFIAHCSESFTAEIVRRAVARAEAQYLSIFVNSLEQAKQGQLVNRIQVDRDNILDVKVLLQEPLPWMLVRGEKEGMRPCMVCAFEIEGTFQLPDTGRPMFVRGLLKGSIHEIKPIAEHWRTMFNEVFNIAVDFLNADYAASISPTVRAQTHL